MVLSLKYLIYSGPMYRGGLQVIRNTEHREKMSEIHTGPFTGFLQTHSGISDIKEYTCIHRSPTHIPLKILSEYSPPAHN